MKWVLLETAPDQLAAEMWADFLKEQGVPAILQPTDVISFLGMSNLPCRVMVPEENLEQAKTLIEEFKNSEIVDEDGQPVESDQEPTP